MQAKASMILMPLTTLMQNLILLQKVSLVSPRQGTSQAFSCEICGGSDHATSYCGGSMDHVAWVNSKGKENHNFNNHEAQCEWWMEEPSTTPTLPS